MNKSEILAKAEENYKKLIGHTLECRSFYCQLECRASELREFTSQLNSAIAKTLEAVRLEEKKLKEFLVTNTKNIPLEGLIYKSEGYLEAVAQQQKQEESFNK